MPAPALVDQLVAAGLAEDFAAVASLPGAGNHAQVLRFASSLRGDGLKAVVEGMTDAQRIAFIKALAVYENTVNGLGSVTPLCRLIPLAPGDDEATIDWVVSHTRSYDYYANGARSLAEALAAEAARAAGRAATARQEAERERVAKDKRAARASTLLYNAVRRGDLKAVQGLLAQGASADARTPDGEDLEAYAERHGRSEIAAVLHQARNQR
jgi:hypothetical protein